jgi:hypothetical protein
MLAHVGGSRQTWFVSEVVSQAELIAQAVTEVDESLIEWCLQLPVIERLRAASRSAAVLERLSRAASANR